MLHYGKMKLPANLREGCKRHAAPGGMVQSTGAKHSL